MRLATQIGSSLAGVLYILDEPSIGLHQKDNARLICSAAPVRDGGNSVLVIEHDPETILAADYVIDMGPAAGVLGGEVIAQGTPAELSRDLAHSPDAIYPARWRFSAAVAAQRYRRFFAHHQRQPTQFKKSHG